MNFDHNINENACQHEVIIAYLDGELTPDEELELEFHFADCKTCADAINAHKKISNSLEIILEDEMKHIKLPENFSKVVTAKAESNVSGLRQKKEISYAFVICAALVFFLTAGFSSKFGAFSAVPEKFVDQFLAVSIFGAHIVYDAAIGVSIICRSLCHKFIFSSIISLVLVAVFFFIAFLSLSRLILRENR